MKNNITKVKTYYTLFPVFYQLTPLKITYISLDKDIYIIYTVKNFLLHFHWSVMLSTFFSEFSN